ncbi:MAG: CoA pyrophosphatase [Spirochaetaceae bacterium]|nr:MAG: CoA pyrophosphatase [Spirochaetaceae bacterium]
MGLPAFLSALKTCLEGGELPGLDAQMRMAPQGRTPEAGSRDAGTIRYAAVLLVLFDERDPSILLIRRPDDGSTHSGELAFPGGGFEEGDVFPEGTALREAHEELGLKRQHLSVIGTLSPIFIPVSSYQVVPVVAWAETLAGVAPASDEVSEVLPVPLRVLRSAPVRRVFPTPSGEIVAPCWIIHDDRPDLPPLWGASAMAASELIDACGES